MVCSSRPTARDIEDHPALRTPRAALVRARAQAELVDATPIDNPEVGIFGRQEHNDQYATDRSLDLGTDHESAHGFDHHRRSHPDSPADGGSRSAESPPLKPKWIARAEYDRAKRVVAAEINAARVALATARRAAGIANGSSPSPTINSNCRAKRSSSASSAPSIFIACARFNSRRSAWRRTPRSTSASRSPD